MNAGSALAAWHEVADSHPAARTTTVHVCKAPDPRAAASDALKARLALEPLHERVYDKFVSSGGWSGWRVAAPAKLAGRWLYTRPAVEGAGTWPPLTWLDCLARYDGDDDDTAGDDHSERDGVGIAGDDDAGWEERMRRDLAVAAALAAAMGTGGEMDPFPGAGRRIGGEVIKTTLADIRDTYAAEGPGTRIEPRGLAAVSTKIGVRRATEHLVEPHFIDRAEAWLRDRAANGATLDETDRLELRLLSVLEGPRFITLMGCCALAAMCELDPEAAELWYRTGGGCFGHPDIRQYTALAREHLPEPPPPAGGGVKRKPGRADKEGSDKARLVHCGAPTLTGSICRHKVSPAAAACPAGHPQSSRPA